MNSDNLLFVIFAVLVVLGIVLVPFWLSFYRFLAASRVLKRIAAEFDGDYVDQGLRRVPQAILTRRGVRFAVSARNPTGSRDAPILAITAAWPVPGVRISISGESAATHVKKLMGMSDVEIGIKEFDDAFFLQTNQEGELKTQLTDPVQRLLFDIRAIGRWQQFSVNIMAGQFSLEKQLGVGDTSQVFRFIEKSLDLFFQLYTDESAAIQFIDDQVTVLRTPLCLVCGEQIQERRVHCRACRTPHHQECWEYVGKCSTFGCGAHKYKKGKAFTAKKLWIR